MADTKISGLVAVAAFLGTHEYAVNEAGTSKKITGTQLIAAVAQGAVANGYAAVTANQGPFTAATDLTSLTVTVTLVAGRRYRVTGKVGYASSVGTDFARVSILEGATVLDAGAVVCGASFNTAIAIAILTPSGGAHTYKLQGQRDQGSGNITMQASATQVAFILVEDITT